MDEPTSLTLGLLVSFLMNLQLRTRENQPEGRGTTGGEDVTDWTAVTVPRLYQKDW
jgi:hypothetical protein